MRCPQYEPAKSGRCYCDLGASCTYQSRRDECQNGFIPFWTPVERAGLKEMGERISMLRSLTRADKRKNRLYIGGIKCAILAFVAAARKAKG